MSSKSASNDKSSDMTSPPGQAPQVNSEAAYLAQQAVDAKAAIGETLKAMQNSLKETVDISAWTQQYPWIAIGAAAAAGFTAATFVTPRRGESWEHKLAGMVPTAAQPIDPTAPPGATGYPPPPQQSPFSGLWNSLILTLADTLKTTVQSAVVAAVTTKTAQEPPPQNGEPTPAEANAG